MILGGVDRNNSMERSLFRKELSDLEQTVQLQVVNLDSQIEKRRIQNEYTNLEVKKIDDQCQNHVKQVEEVQFELKAAKFKMETMKTQMQKISQSPIKSSINQSLLGGSKGQDNQDLEKRIKILEGLIDTKR